MGCENRDKAWSLEKFWTRIQEIVPPGGEITWTQLWKEFGRKGTGLCTAPLLEKGLLHTTIKGTIKVEESRRGEKIE